MLKKISTAMEDALMEIAYSENRFNGRFFNKYFLGKSFFSKYFPNKHLRHSVNGRAGLVAVFLLAWVLHPAILHGIDLPFPGRFTQQFSHQIVSIDNTSYYSNNGVVNELNFLERDNRERIVSEIFSFESRSAYLHPYFALMFDYDFFQRNKLFFTSIETEKKDEAVKQTSHVISPAIFGIFRPLRVGLTYHKSFGDEILASDQALTLRPPEAISFHLQLFFDKIPKTALGVGMFYQFAFDPALALQEIAKQYYQKAGLTFHIYMAYYLHFRLLFSWERSEAPFEIARLAEVAASEDTNVNGTPSSNLVTYSLNHRTRYILQYSFIYGFTEELAFFANIAQVVYSTFESPDYRFKIGLNLNFGSDSP